MTFWKAWEVVSGRGVIVACSIGLLRAFSQPYNCLLPSIRPLQLLLDTKVADALSCQSATSDNFHHI